MLEHTVSVSITKRTRTAPPRCAARLLVAALLLLFAACEAAHAVDPQQKLAQLHHTVWTSRDGCPGDVSVLAQTSDGFLWVGSSTGLYRFDGKRFQRFDTLFGSSALADDISALHATPEGGLWIGHRLGGAHFLQAGRLHAYGVREGLPENTVLSFLEEDQGVVWAGTSVGLYRLSGQTWTRVPVTEKHAAPALMRLSKGRDGTVWLSSFGPAFYRLAGESVYREIASDKCLGYVTLDADSEAWVVDAAGTHLLLDPSRRIQRCGTPQRDAGRPRRKRMAQ